MQKNTVPTMWAQIHIAGDIHVIRRVCHLWCTDTSFCVTVTPTSYVYNGGIQEGATIRMIHYPKYPTAMSVLRTKARNLADKLLVECCQYSYTVEDSEETYWHDEHPNTAEQARHG